MKLGLLSSEPGLGCKIYAKYYVSIESEIHLNPPKAIKSTSGGQTFYSPLFVALMLSLILDTSQLVRA